MEEQNMPVYVRNLRRRLRMTQEQFGHALGITVGTVSRWENGRNRPSPLAVAEIRRLAYINGRPV